MKGVNYVALYGATRDWVDQCVPTHAWCIPECDGHQPTAHSYDNYITARQCERVPRG